MPIHPNTPQCHHIKVSGSRCGSPALRNDRFCYFHHRAYMDRVDFRIPLIEDAESLQIAINEVLRGLFTGQLNVDEARVALYALRISAINVPRTYFRPVVGASEAQDSPADELLKKACIVALDRARRITEQAQQRPASFSAPSPTPPGDGGSQA